MLGNTWSGPGFDVDMFIVVAVLVFATGWLLVAIARLQTAWQTGIRNTAGLKQQQVNEAKEMLKMAQEVLSLEEEIKEARTAADQTAKQRADREKMLSERPPPPPTEVVVSSEFAASKREKPWIAHMKRTGGNRARRYGFRSRRAAQV